MNRLDHASADLCDRVRAAASDGIRLHIRGAGSKDFYTGLTRDQAGIPNAQWLDTAPLSGVVSYEPSELVVVAGAGTPLPELEDLLAAQNQYLPFEPPHFSVAGGTVGGMVAAGLSGPGRASVGSVRDYVLGARLVNGLGQHLTFGGQVMKNVAGYDVSRLMAGALGTLGVLTEISLKVLPFPTAQATLRFAVEAAPALEALHRWGGRPLPLNASTWLRDPQGAGQLVVRLCGALAAVEAGCRTLLAELPGERWADAEALVFWNNCRNQRHAFFQGRSNPAAVLWRLSVPQTAPVSGADFDHALIEWHGGLRWLWAPLQRAGQIQQLAQALGGHAKVWHCAGELAPGHARLDSQQPALAAISRQLKASFDPHGIFNPGLTPHAN